jgi:hypothetical protein
VAGRTVTRNVGLSLIVRMEYIMANSQNTSKAKGSGQDTSDDLTKQSASGLMPLGASKSSRKNMTATILRVLRKTWSNAELEELRRKAGLVAGALADFQAAGGLVVTKNMEYEGGKFVKIFLVVDKINLVAQRTADGMDFDISLVAEAK